jgi:CoA:oxalate CoA-transferase
MTGPLSGVRVLDLSQWQQGPYATVLLSDMGAEVIKVERPQYGDAGRSALGGPDPHGVAPDFFAHNRGKRGMTVDLSHPKGREIALKLAEGMDVVVTNFRLGVMEEWGLGYDAFRERNPRIIYAQASGSGPKGPNRERPMFDIVAQAMGGLMSVTGEEGRMPLPVGAFIGDQVGAIVLALGITSALYNRERTGAGQSIDVSLLGTQVALQSFEITHHLFTGEVPKPGGRGHPHTAWLWYTFPAADGHFTMAGVRDDKWNDFCEIIGDPDLAEDPRFDTYDARAENRDQLVERLDAAFKKRDVAHWAESLGTIDVACGPVRTYDQVVADPQVIENRYIDEMEHPHLGRIRYVNTPIEFSETPVQSRGPQPELGQHTEEVLLELGYDWSEIVSLREEGAI